MTVDAGVLEQRKRIFDLLEKTHDLGDLKRIRVRLETSISTDAKKRRDAHAMCFSVNRSAPWQPANRALVLKMIDLLKQRTGLVTSPDDEVDGLSQKFVFVALAHPACAALGIKNDKSVCYVARQLLCRLAEAVETLRTEHEDAGPAVVHGCSERIPGVTFSAGSGLAFSRRGYAIVDRALDLLRVRHEARRRGRRQFENEGIVVRG